MTGIMRKRTASELENAGSPARLRIRAATILAAACACAFFALPAEAAEEPVTPEEIIEDAIANPLKHMDFQAQRSPNQFCQIVIGEEGQLWPQPATHQLSSLGFGGRPATAQVYASNGSYRLSIDAPLGFTIAPAGGNDGVTFVASMSGTGATSFTSTPGAITQKLRAGTTDIQAFLVADRGGEPFPAGQYQAQLTLRCE